MDIRKFAVEETGVLELVGPSEEPLLDDEKKPITVTLYGPGSRQYARAQSAQSNRMIDKLKKKGKSDQTAEERARETAEFLSACTKEFSPNLEYGDLKGEALHRAVYSDVAIGFIAEQVNKHLSDWGNFSQRSTTN